MLKRSIVALLAACGLLAGCALATAMHGADAANVDSFSDLKNGQAMLVGRIVLDPPMGKDEVVIDTHGSWMPDGIKAMLKEANLFIGTGPGPKDGEPDKGAYAAIVKSPFNTLFFARLDQGTSYLQVMSYVVAYGSNISQKANGASGMQQNMQKAFMHLDSRITASPGDQVIYVGTLKFKRDDYNNFKGLQVTDNSATDLPQIKQKFGDSVKVRKVLVSAR